MEKEEEEGEEGGGIESILIGGRKGESTYQIIRSGDIQWNLSIMDTLGPLKLVINMEVSLLWRSLM